jgi:hypothetical protein
MAWRIAIILAAVVATGEYRQLETFDDSSCTVRSAGATAKEILQKVSPGCFRESRYSYPAGSLSADYSLKIVGEKMKSYDSANCTGTVLATENLSPFWKQCSICPSNDCKASNDVPGKFKKSVGICIQLCSTSSPTTSSGFPVACNRLLLSTFIFFATTCCI